MISRLKLKHRTRKLSKKTGGIRSRTSPARKRDRDRKPVKPRRHVCKLCGQPLVLARVERRMAFRHVNPETGLLRAGCV
jgi:hypothetical protein